MKKIIFLALMFSYLQVSAECSLSTMPPVVSPGDSQISVEWRVKGACGEEPNEFKVYFQKNGNWFPVTTVLAGANQAKYIVDWDISDIEDGDYKVRVLQGGENTVYITSSSFTIDRIAPVIRDDLWILPTGGEIFRGKVILKWNKESIFDLYRLSDNPITIQYSQQGDDFINLAEDIENSGVYVWDTSEINGDNINLKIIAKDTFGNTNFNTLTEGIKIDNISPSSLSIDEINGEAIQNINYVSQTPLLRIGNIDTEDEPVKVLIYDINTEKVYFSENAISKNTSVQLNPISDGEYELVAVAIDSAGNKSEVSNSINVIRDGFPPKAPEIKSAILNDGTISVEVGSLDANDKLLGELILMNGNSLMRSQKSTNPNFVIEMVSQGLYELSVVHKDVAGNASDRSTIKTIIYDTKAPQYVNISGPLNIALYGNINIKISAIDNVGIKNYDVFIDSESIGISEDGKFIIDTKKFKNGPHRLKAMAFDYSGKFTESKEYDIKIFNSEIENHWANNYIRELFDDGYLSGEANNGRVNPEGTMNRASALKFIMSVFGIEPNNNDLNSVFSDVDSRSWYGPYVKSAFENGKLTGFQSKHKVSKINSSYDYANVYNLQFALKGLGYNLQATGVYDSKTIAAISNYQRFNGLNVSGSLGLSTVSFLNDEDAVKTGELIIDKFVYFKPGDLINRVQVLKMVLDFSGININEVGGTWYEKYTQFAQKKRIMVGDKSGNLMLEKPVNVGELSKIVLKVKDILNEQ